MGRAQELRAREQYDDVAPPDGGARERENWHGEKRSNATDESSTDSQAKSFRKSRRTGALRCYIGHLLMYNRYGPVMNAQVTQASGTAERDAAAQMLADAAQVASVPITVCADKNYDTVGFVANCRANGVDAAYGTKRRPRGWLGDRRSHDTLGRLRHQSAQAQMHRAGLRLGKTVGRIRQATYRERVGQLFLLTQTAYNLTRGQSGVEAQIGEKMALVPPEIRTLGIKSTRTKPTRRSIEKPCCALVRCISTAG
jgi:hypothetical protein